MPPHDFSIIESTLREGEQFVGADFTSEDKVEIAQALADFGVEYIELTSPCASPRSRADCARIASLGLDSKVLTHIRCHMDDARIAVDTGADGIDVVIGTSSYLREFSHGKSIDQVIDLATDVLTFIHSESPEIELRFSTEDSFRSTQDDLLRVYTAINKLEVVDRFGVADTVGIASPKSVYDLVRILHELTHANIEFHGHNDTGCAIANSYAALEAGATHIDTTVLGIGERNGITPLEGLIARLYAIEPDSVRTKYRLHRLHDLNQLVADRVGIEIPFNHYITGVTAFTHKAGIHAKAILNNPETYEILDPADFGLTRYISIAHKLTGWNAVHDRAAQLGLKLDPTILQAVTRDIKAMADHKRLTLSDVDELLHQCAEVINASDGGTSKATQEIQAS
ncbi:MAG: homocitrate synthase [Anaerolineales bacterium]|nr:homocitrate synthase [Anaerolineales bacterium]